MLYEYLTVMHVQYEFSEQHIIIVKEHVILAAVLAWTNSQHVSKNVKMTDPPKNNDNVDQARKEQQTNNADIIIA